MSEESLVSPARLRKALDDLVYLPSLKEAAEARATPAELLGAQASESGEAAEGVCRPWDRDDLNRRLQTFKVSTWFCKPTSIDALRCARNGWVNTGNDRLSCRSCNASLEYHMLPGASATEQRKTADGFATRLQAGHAPGCPWLGNPCDDNLASYPPLPQPQVAAAYALRLSELHALTHLPALAGDAVHRMAATHRSQLEVLLGHMEGSGAREGAAEPGSQSVGLASTSGTQAAVAGSPEFAGRAALLAACGWGARLLPPQRSAELRRWDSGSGGGAAVANGHRAVLCCSTCGARAGLWAHLPRGDAGETSDKNLGPAATRSTSEAGSLIASLSQSIAGGSPPGKEQAAAATPVRTGPRFGRPEDTPVFRSLSRSLSRAMSTDAKPSSEPASAGSSDQKQPRPAPAQPLREVPAPQMLPEGSGRDLQPAFHAAAAPGHRQGAHHVKSRATILPARSNEGPDSAMSRPDSLTSPSDGSARAGAAAAHILGRAESAATDKAAEAEETARDGVTASKLPLNQDSSRAAVPGRGVLGGWGEAATASPAFGAQSNMPSFGAQPRPASGGSSFSLSIPKAAPAAKQSMPSSIGLTAEVTKPFGASFAQRVTSDSSEACASAKPFGSQGHLAPAFGSGGAMGKPKRTLEPLAPAPTAAAAASPAALQPLRAPESSGGVAQVIQASTADISQLGGVSAALAAASPANIGAEVGEKRGRPSDASDRVSPGEGNKRARLERAAPALAPPAHAATPGAGGVSAAAGARGRRDNKLAVAALVVGDFDPLRQHRPFCPWILRRDGVATWRSGWSWTLESLVPGGQVDGGGGGEGGGSRGSSQRSLDSAARLREALSKIQSSRARH